MKHTIFFSCKCVNIKTKIQYANRVRENVKFKLFVARTPYNNNKQPTKKEGGENKTVYKPVKYNMQCYTSKKKLKKQYKKNGPYKNGKW